MKNILVIGMTNILGGVETFIHNTYSYFDYTKYHVDYLHHSDNGILFANDFEKNGSNIYYCNKFLSNPLKSYIRQKEILEMGNYDVIHCNACSTNMIAYCLPALFSRKKPLIVMHSHNSLSDKKVRHFLFRPIVNKYADIKLACSDLAGFSMYGKNSDFICIPNGIPLSKYKYNQTIRKKIRTSLGFNEDDIVLGNIGRLVSEKNQAYLIDIMSKLDDRYKCVIIGNGYLKTDLITKIHGLKLQNRVFLLENNDRVNEFYQAFDIYVMTSLYEGLPMTCVEAQAAGLPLILSDRISKTTTLSDCVSYLPLGDTNQWIESITQTCLNHNRSLVDDDRLNNYDSAKVAKQLEFLFEHALTSNE